MRHQWEPIETAPKDGQKVMVCNGNEPGHETPPHAIGIAFFEINGEEGGKKNWLAVDSTNPNAVYKPVFWMPLPDLPKEIYT